MDGILLVEKPSEITSFDVIRRLRRARPLKGMKLGHGGTLDPMATGLLPLFVGKGTKLSQIAMGRAKSYDARILLGTVTDSGDLTGEVLESKEVVMPSRAELLNLLEGFTGKIMQRPPRLSAKKINGKRACDRIRDGEEVPEPEPVEVVVHSLDILEINKESISLRVRCGKGTYIRSLATDLGEKIGCGATLSALARVDACGFSIDESKPLEEIESMDRGAMDSFLIPLISVLRRWDDFTEVVLDDKLKVEAIRHGVDIASVLREDSVLEKEGSFFITDSSGRVSALARGGEEPGYLCVFP